MTATIALAYRKNPSNTPYFPSNDAKTAHHSDSSLLPIIPAWQLNERHYGDLQGLNKEAVRAQFGKEQVQIWRRSFSTRPPGGESLDDTINRVLPYFQETIVPFLQKDKNILISAHGNSLRALVMYLENISSEEIPLVELATGELFWYDISCGNAPLRTPYIRQSIGRMS